MRTVSSFVCILLFTLCAYPAGASPRHPMTSARAGAIEAAVLAGLARTGGKGIAVAVIEDGRPVLVRAYGVRDKAGAPLTTDTLLHGASLTKTVFAYTVLRLRDEGKLDLDRPIASLLARPLPEYGNLPHGMGNWGDLEGDSRWARITPRMALTHSTGFANFAFLEPDQRLRIHFEPGSRYAYSGEGLLLLQFGVEQRLGHGIDQDARRLTFGPLGMRNTSLMWHDDPGVPVSQSWDQAGRAFEHHRSGRVRAAGSMDTTIEDMSRFAAALVNGTNLSPRTHADMLRPQRAITTASQFPTLQPELAPERRRPDLSAGLGLVTFSGPQGRGFFKGGHDDTTANTMVCVRAGRRCAVLLGNDVRIEALFPTLVAAILGETGAPWRWEYPEQFR